MMTSRITRVTRLGPLSCGLLCGVLALGAAGVAHAAPERVAPETGDAAPADGAAAAAPDGDDAAADAPRAAPGPKLKSFPKLKHASLSHDMQFGLAVLSGSGYRGIFPYQDNIFCGKIENGMSARVCSARIPVFVDVQASFGVAAHWDLLVDLRFGAEVDFAGTRQFAVAPGFRYWIEPEDRAKIFTTVQVAYDTTVEHNPALKSYDVAVRNANGLMIEVMRNLGFYAQFGETIGFVRWLRFEIDFGLGVQARFP
jgi:hypothetical protein